MRIMPGKPGNPTINNQSPHYCYARLIMEIAKNFGYNNEYDKFRQNVTGKIYHHITCISLEVQFQIYRIFCEQMH